MKRQEDWEVQTTSWESIVIGQEAICSDGLGRVVEKSITKGEWIRISTYVKDRQCCWAPHNVVLIPIHTVATINIRK